MKLVQFGDIGNIETEYRTILGLNEDGFKSSILDRDKREGLLWDLFNWEESDNSGANLPQIIHDLKEITGKIASGGTDAVPINIHGKLAIRLQQAHGPQPANLDQLWCWWPEDLLRVKYAGDPQASIIRISWSTETPNWCMSSNLKGDKCSFIFKGDWKKDP
jgi:hypothetical protein